jgi:excisionase family DNA binding protein
MPPYRNDPDDLESLSREELIAMVRALKTSRVELLDSQPLLLGAPDAAELLGVSVTLVRQMVEHDKIPHFRLPQGRPRFSRVDLERWLAAHTSGGQA